MTLLDLVEKKLKAKTHFYYHDDDYDIILIARICDEGLEMQHPDRGQVLFLYSQHNNKNVMPVTHIRKKPFYSVTLRDDEGYEWTLTSKPVVD